MKAALSTIDDVPLRRTRTPSDSKWTVNELAAVKGEIEHIDREVTRLKQRRASSQPREWRRPSTVSQVIAAEVHPAAVAPVHAHPLWGPWQFAQIPSRDAQGCAPRSSPHQCLGRRGCAGIRAPLFVMPREGGFADNTPETPCDGCGTRRGRAPHDYAGLPTMSGVWRWKTPTPSLDELRKEEAVAGQHRRDASWR